MNFRLTNEIAACKILQEGPGYVKGCIKKSREIQTGILKFT
jgi:hypothetical protein